MINQANGTAAGSGDRCMLGTRLTQYAMAAAGAATGVVGVSEAAVVMSTAGSPLWSGTFSGPVNATVTQATATGISVNQVWGDALLNNAFTAFMLRGLSTASARFRGGALNAAAGNGVRRSVLASGAVIGGGGGVSWANSVAAASFGTRSLATGFQPAAASINPWSMNAATGAPGTGNADSVRGYVAFRIGAGGSDFYYGYFDLEYSRSGNENGSSFTMTVHGWAYESTLNQSITIGAPSAVPGGAGLAALAFGAAGLRGRRRSRN
jgi:hypothetical protein